MSCDAAGGSLRAARRWDGARVRWGGVGADGQGSQGSAGAKEDLTDLVPACLAADHPVRQGKEQDEEQHDGVGADIRSPAAAAVGSAEHSRCRHHSDSRRRRPACDIAVLSSGRRRRGVVIVVAPDAGNWASIRRSGSKPTGRAAIILHP